MSAITAWVILSFLSADPAAEQRLLLKTFRDELVAIQTAGSNLKPYAIGKYEVTQSLWQSVMGDNPSRWKGPRNSVELISLPEARDFCDRVTRLMQRYELISRDERVRLPTEEEWEFAARAGATTKYSFGDQADHLGDYAWFTGNAAGNDPPVGAKKPNPWGLYDVHGYLWEWTEPNPGAAQDSAVVRGGSWKDPATNLVSSSRRLVQATLRDDAVGLRCVLIDEQKTPQANARSSLTTFTSQAAGDFTAQAQDQIVPANSKLEKLWDQGEFTEGPALAPDGSILFSDIGDAIYRYDPKSGDTTPFRQPGGRANGLMFNRDGALIACEGANTGGNRRISITTGTSGGKDGTVKTLADRYDGKRFNSPNDLAIDREGRVYFTDPRYVGNEPRELDFEAIFLVSPTGEVKIATRAISKPNGILVSPDGKTVYASDNNPQGPRHLVSFAVQPDGTLLNKQVLFDFGAGRGIDGMAIDTRGNLYATAGTGDKAAVYVFDPAGKPLARIPTPGDPTNCCFGGGSDASSLYITCANEKLRAPKYGLYRIKLNIPGFEVVTGKAPMAP